MTTLPLRLPRVDCEKFEKGLDFYSNDISGTICTLDNPLVVVVFEMPAGVVTSDDPNSGALRRS